MTTPEQVEAIRDEQRLETELTQAQADEQEAQAILSQCVTVVDTMHGVLALALGELAHLDKVQHTPTRYGTNQAKARKAYYAKGREVRALRAELKAAVSMLTKARRAVTATQVQQKTIARALKANKRAQVALGLTPPMPTRTQQALEEIASYSGMLDGGW